MTEERLSEIEREIEEAGRMRHRCVASFEDWGPELIKELRAERHRADILRKLVEKYQRT